MIAAGSPAAHATSARPSCLRTFSSSHEEHQSDTTDTELRGSIGLVFSFGDSQDFPEISRSENRRCNASLERGCGFVLVDGDAGEIHPLSKGVGSMSSIQTIVASLLGVTPLPEGNARTRSVSENLSVHPHGPLAFAGPLPFGFGPAPSARTLPPQLTPARLERRQIFRRLCVKQISCHSADTFSSPRNRNLRIPRADLIWPNTGSTMCLRAA